MKGSTPKRKEADLGIRFRHWIKANPWGMTCHFEMKQTEGESIPFNCLEEHQITYGEAIRDSSKGVLMRNIGTNGEPDYTYSYRDPVYIVVGFPREFFIIPLATFVREKAISKRKSLTRERARAIAITVV